MSVDRCKKFRQRALDHCFIFSVDDPAAMLARLDLARGVAGLHWVQETLGIGPDASFVSAAHFTVFRRARTRAAGFAYGGRMQWSGDIVPLKLKPNACGVLVAGLPYRPDQGKLRRGYGELVRETVCLEGVPLEWDLGRGNHFLNIYKVGSPELTNGFEYLAMLHTSGREVLGENPLGPGLYPDLSPSLAARARKMKTPWGGMPCLLGDDARAYHEYYRLVDNFAKRRRSLLVGLLFDRAEVLFNETHLGYEGPGNFLSGCYGYPDSARARPWYPLTLGPERTAWLIRPLQVYRPELWTASGLGERAELFGLSHRLAAANILPHGGGYRLKGMNGLKDFFDPDGPVRHFRPWSRLLRFSPLLPLAPRGEDVLDLVLAQGAGQAASALVPVSSLG